MCIRDRVEEVHRRGMKIILDGVFNHCGSFNKWMDRERIYENQPGYEKGAYVSQDKMCIRDRSEKYQRLFEVYKKMYPALKERFRELSELDI